MLLSLWRDRCSQRRRTASGCLLNHGAERLEARELLTAGDLDPNFGNNGWATADFDWNNDGANSLVIQDDGKIVVAGASGWDSDTAPAESRFALTRYRPDGSLDTSFGTGGKQTTDFGANRFAEIESGVTGVAIQNDGKVVAAGSVAGNHGWDFALARYLVDGSLDQSFGSRGKRTTDIKSGNNTISSMAIQKDGKIVVAGTADLKGDYDFAIARYLSNGSLDPAFGVSGIQTTDFGSSFDGVNCMAIQSDGKIVVAGRIENGAQWDFALARYRSNGGLDTTFGIGGKQVTDVGRSFEGVHSIAIQSDGKILVAGWTYLGSNYRSVVVRYDANGMMDSAFGDQGIQKFDFGLHFAQTDRVALTSDGKILVIGHGFDHGSNFVVVVQLKTDGTIDASFANDGRLIVPLPEGAGAVTSAIDRFGKFIVVGSASAHIETPSPNTDFFVAKFSADPDRLGLDAVVSLPPKGGAATAYLIGRELHLRRSQNAPDLVPPLDLTDVATLRFNGSEYADQITLDRSFAAFPGAITFHGSDGDDVFDASVTGINVTFDGGQGGDRFIGGGGSDFADGGPGADRLDGGRGFDSLLGGDGRDTIIGGGENDVIDGGDDHDTLIGGDGDDSLRGGNGNDRITGGKGNDLLLGSAGNDSLYGESGIDTLLGETGDDLLNGGVGSDIINPGTGRKTIQDAIRVIDTSFTFDFDLLLAGIL